MTRGFIAPVTPIYEFHNTKRTVPDTQEAHLYELDGVLVWPELHNLDELRDPNYQKICYGLDETTSNHVITFRSKILKDYTEQQLLGLPILSYFLRDFGIWPHRVPQVILEYKKQVLEKLLHRYRRVHFYDSDEVILKAVGGPRVVTYLIAHQEDPFVGTLTYPTT